MSTAIQNKLITAEEYLQMPDPPDGSKQELVQGVIVAMAQPGFQHGEVQVNSAFLLKTYERACQSGRVGTETGVVTKENPDTLRGPDVSYCSIEKFPKDHVNDRLLKIEAADLALLYRQPENQVIPAVFEGYLPQVNLVTSLFQFAQIARFIAFFQARTQLLFYRFHGFLSDSLLDLVRSLSDECIAVVRLDRA